MESSQDRFTGLQDITEGGLGEAVREALATEGVRVYKCAVTELPRSGNRHVLLDLHGISADHIVNTAVEVISCIS